MQAKETNFGYKQELRRSMGGFSSFAISFSLISVSTGIFANFNFGFKEVGGWIIWSWLVVAIGQCTVAWVMARLSVRFPIAGYGYQWAARLVNPHVGFFIGWMLLLQFMTGFPAIVQTAVVTLANVTGLHLEKNGVIAGSLLLISLITLVHLSGIRTATKINDLGVYTELLGVAAIIVMLTWFLIQHIGINPSLLSDNTHYPSGSSATLSSFSLSLLLAAWGLTGFEAAADLAEETHAPAKTVPKAVMLSFVSSAVSGFLMLGLLVLASKDIKETQGKENPLMFILHNSIGTGLTSVIMVVVLISILACAIASMATASRLLFSMARDSMFPYSGSLGSVHSRSKTPRKATIAVWLISSLVIVLFHKIELISSISALASYLGYAGIMWACLRDQKSFLAFAALCWSIFIALALALPESEASSVEPKHLPALAVGTVFVVGALIYQFYTRNKINKGEAGPPQSSPSTT